MHMDIEGIEYITSINMLGINALKKHLEHYFVVGNIVGFPSFTQKAPNKILKHPFVKIIFQKIEYVLSTKRPTMGAYFLVVATKK